MNPVAASRLSVDEDVDLAPASIADAVASIARKDLAPLAADIDAGTVYPAELLRRLGDAGAWGSHRPDNDAADLRCAIQSIAALGEVCGATAFMAWCQNTLVWYAANSNNPALAAGFADDVATGKILGGTGLSNPMKTFFGIEKLKLRGRRVDGGYVVRGALPWVSNLGPDHFFGTIFEVEDCPGEIVMFLADCSDPAITLQSCKPFLAMDGTGTYSVQFRDVFVPTGLILAEKAGPFVKRIRAGFILLQTGMGLGLIRDCVAIMNEVAAPSVTSIAICRNSRRISRSCLPRSRWKPWISRVTRSTRTTAIGAAWSRCGFALATPASPPRMPRCSIAARAVTSGAIACSAGFARLTSSPSSLRPPSSFARCCKTFEFFWLEH